MENNPLIHAAGLIESVLTNKQTAAAALEAWPYAYNVKNSKLAKAWTHLARFADDDDIHKVDESYFESEKEKLKQCINELLFEAERAKEQQCKCPEK